MSDIPFYEQTMHVRQIYACRICDQPEEYRAIDDIARYAHLCKQHWLDAPLTEKVRYIGVKKSHDPT